jgi:hypothetical protein
VSSGTACCRTCGLLFKARLDACARCGSADVRRLSPTRVVGAVLQACGACGDVLRIFATQPDPLLLSLHAVLVAPFELASHGSGDPTRADPDGAEPSAADVGLTIF